MLYLNIYSFNINYSSLKFIKIFYFDILFNFTKILFFINNRSPTCRIGQLNNRRIKTNYIIGRINSRKSIKTKSKNYLRSYKIMCRKNRFSRSIFNSRKRIYKNWKGIKSLILIKNDWSHKRLSENWFSMLS